MSDYVTKKIALPGGRVIDIVYFSDATEPDAAERLSESTDLHVCRECEGTLVYPVSWEERPGDRWSIERRCPDRTPADYKAEPTVNKYMMEHLKVNTFEQLLLRLESDMRRLEPRYVGPPFKTHEGGVVEDYWGIRSKHLKADHGSYDMHVHTPVWDAKSVADLEKHNWPTCDIFDYSVMREQCARYRDYAIMYEGADLFTRPCILRNMENVMFDMVERPDMAHYLFDKFTTFYCEDITRSVEATDGGFDIYGEGGRGWNRGGSALGA
jgi:uroporphyrinogen decarboxylase